MPLIDFPDVPNVPGVPALARSFTIPTVDELVVGALGGFLGAIFGYSRWGVFGMDGSAALVFESFLGIRYRNGSRIAKHPVEQGGFASYNKVSMPFDAIVRGAFSGDLLSRTELLTRAEAMVKSTDLFSIVTPEATYVSANLVSFSYERTTQNGSSMLILDLAFEEVRETASVQFSKTQEASGADQVSNGQVQTFPIDAPGSVAGTPLPATSAGSMQ